MSERRRERVRRVDGERRATVVFDREDWDLLLRFCKEEKLTKADIIRRAIRSYRPTVLMPELPETRNAANG